MHCVFKKLGRFLKATRLGKAVLMCRNAWNSWKVNVTENYEI